MSIPCTICGWTTCRCAEGGSPFQQGIHPILKLTAADVLAEMANTYRERNAVYGDNFRMVGPMMQILFPKGVPPEVLHSDQFHLFELILVKLSRFAVSQLKHKDSIHDSAVYGAMIEAIIDEQNSNHRS